MKDDFERGIATELGTAVKAKRLEAGLSQDRLAELLDVGPETVSRIERGTVMTTIPRLVEIANALGCPVEMLIPRANGSSHSGGAEIAELLKPLSKSDARFVVEVMQRVVAHLATK